VVEAGTGQTLPLTTGQNVFYGALADNPGVLPQRWISSLS
jgi:hypothetical protein